MGCDSRRGKAIGNVVSTNHRRGAFHRPTVQRQSESSPLERFFEHLRTITAYIVFPTWDGLLAAIADLNARPP